MPAINKPGPVPLASLDGVARLVRRAEEAATYADSFASPGSEADARAWAKRAKEHCTTALYALETMGATLPGIETNEPLQIVPTPFHLLSSPAARRLLDALEVAAEAGAAVDDERGGEGIGETLEGLLLRFRLDVEGPAGRD